MAPTQVQQILDRLDELEHTIIAKIDTRVTVLEIAAAENRGATLERARIKAQGDERTGFRVTLLGIVAGFVGALASALIYILGTALVGSTHP
jgi:hypothetical protein